MPIHQAIDRVHSPYSVMVSITNPGDKDVPLTLPEERILRLCFRDLKVPDPLVGTFTLAQAVQIRDFAARWHQVAERVEFLVHCHAGQSRSAAIAKWVGDTMGAKVVGEPSDIGTRLANPLVYELLEKATQTTN